MIRLILLLLVTALAVASALILLEDIGYILLAYQDHTLETSMVVFVLSLLTLFVLLYLLVRGLGLMMRIPNFIADQKLVRARKDLAFGILALDEGEWLTAERSLVKNVDNSDSQILNYLAAARAAHEQGAIERRDEYLRKADGQGAEIVLAMTRAQLLMDQQQWAEAELLLLQLQEKVPKKKAILKSLVQVYEAQAHWAKLVKLLPQLRKSEIFSIEKLTQIAATAYTGRLKTEAIREGIVGLQGVWETMPKEMKKNAEVLIAYAATLVKLKQHGEGAVAIEDYLAKKWDPRLVYWYGLLSDVKAKGHLEKLELWRAQHDLDWEVYISLARVAAKQNLWGKAETYLKICLERWPSAEVYWELSQLAQANETKQKEWLTQAMQMVASERWAFSSPAH